MKTELRTIKAFCKTSGQMRAFNKLVNTFSNSSITPEDELEFARLWKSYTPEHRAILLDKANLDEAPYLRASDLKFMLPNKDFAILVTLTLHPDD